MKLFHLCLNHENSEKNEHSCIAYTRIFLFKNDGSLGNSEGKGAHFLHCQDVALLFRCLQALGSPTLECHINSPWRCSTNASLSTVLTLLIQAIYLYCHLSNSDPHLHYSLMSCMELILSAFSCHAK